ncbi:MULTISPECIES: glycosyltransferase [Shewanella]|uniref:glycosyltransferase n=1 Tax=Shewanella TaxID=22 RepID=UPI0001530962|nr:MULTISPECIES: glycosyltransferase [Shewanella]ACK48746.1 glycosyl transferase group 1 [Shewanella baltica OS223]AVT47626.1 glycosyltransferase [Shewanella baltica]MCS6114033.1 glycosyltransferase [Shewanella baltica]MCS6129108.1 glycosyltransferase [Shewanella baltica]MCS6141038.1 glycosyltransferase [Shewanella baltica]
MRIAIAIDSLAGGGAEKVMITLAKQFIRLGHEPHFLVMEDNRYYETPEDLPVHQCFAPKDKDFDHFVRLNASVHKLSAKIAEIESKVGKFDLFLSNLDKTNLMMTKTGVSPLYVIVHSSVEEELSRQFKLGPFAYFKKLRAKKALNGQHLITVSNGIANEIKDKGRLHPASMQTIYNPFEFNDITSQSQQDNPQIPQGDYLIHVGRFAKQKRHDVLFEALKLTQNQLPVVLLCHNHKKAIKAAKKFGIEKRLIIPGFQSNPFPWIKQAKALVLSSDFEGLPTVLIESLACGTPVVSTDCPHGPSEILTGNLAPYLVPRRDPAALAKMIDEVVSQPPSLEQVDILAKVDATLIAEQYLALAK